MYSSLVVWWGNAKALQPVEAVNLSNQQKFTLFQSAETQNQMFPNVSSSDMAVNVGTAGNMSSGNVPQQVVLGNQSIEKTKPGCVGPFLGQFGCLLFLFFWIPFLIVMVGTLIFPKMVLLTAPVVCDEGYQEAYAERVGYYSSGNFEGNNIVLLHCVYEAGRDEIPHPLQVDAIIFAVPMAFLTVVAFGLALFGRIRVFAKI